MLIGVLYAMECFLSYLGLLTVAEVPEIHWAGKHLNN